MWVLTLNISVYLLDPTPYVEIMIDLQPWGQKAQSRLPVLDEAVSITIGAGLQKNSCRTVCLC